MTKRRGSVMIFVVVLIVSLTTAILATVALTSSIGRDERIYEDRVRMGYAFEGAMEQAAQDFTAGTLSTLPSSRNVNIQGVACSLTITDNNANIPHTMLMSGTATYHGRTISESKVVGKRVAPNPFYYALFVNNGFTYTGALNTGASGANGDVYANGMVIFSGTGTINGNLESTATVNLGTETVTGTQYVGDGCLFHRSVPPTTARWRTKRSLKGVLAALRSARPPISTTCCTSTKPASPSGER